MKLGHPQAWDHGKPVTPSPSTMASGMMQRVLSKINIMNRLLGIICSEGTMATPHVPTHTGSLTGREARGEDAAEGHNRAPHKEIISGWAPGNLPAREDVREPFSTGFDSHLELNGHEVVEHG
jgi:hypothetical protein